MSWGGVPLNARTAAMMDEAQALYGATITATQGSPSTSVAASGTTHAGEGVIDVSGANLDAIVVAMRQVGFAAWHRTPAQGFVHHVHGVAVGEPGLSSTAAQQVQAYFAGRNGLANNGPDDGPRDWVGITWETYTGGTYVPPAGGDPTLVFGQYPGDRCGAWFYNPDAILTGSPTLDGSGTWRISEIDTVVTTLTLHPGDSVVLEALQDWSYYPVPDGVTRAYWMLRLSGSGTLAAAAGYDPGYVYPTMPGTFTDLDPAGSDGTFDYWLTTQNLTSAELGDDGAPVLRLTCTGGDIDITWAGLRVEQPQGFYLPVEFVWSATQPDGTRSELFNDFDGYDDAGTLRWSTTDEPVAVVDPEGVITGHGDYDSNTLDDGATFALDNAMGGMAFSSGGSRVFDAGWSGNMDPITSFFPPFFTWNADTWEGLDWKTTPGKGVLPGTPYTMPVVWDWTGEFEWLDDDTHFLGWEIFPDTEGGVEPVAWRLNDSSGTHTGIGPPQGFYLEWGLRGDTGPYTFSTTAGNTADLADGETDVPISSLFEDTDSQVIMFHIGISNAKPSDLRTGHLYSTRISDDENVAHSKAFAWFRIPTWRYKRPTYAAAPTPAPFITDPEDVGQIAYLRNKQRNDGLGNWSAGRGRSRSSQQRSIRGRGYR